MYKIMLIDDDVPMLKYLEKLVAENSLGLSVCASTYSSAKAIALFKSTLPDIVITDIGLPQIDGLELAGKFKSLKPETRMIFLTCHEDFHYAQRAVELDADEYLIKDELTPKQLEKSLKKSLDNYKSSSNRLDFNLFQETIQKHKDILIQHFLEEVLAGRNIDNILDSSKGLGVDWNWNGFVVGKVFIDFHNLPRQYSLQDLPYIKYGILNIAEELALNISGMTPLMDKEKHLYIIFNFKPTLSRNVFEEYNCYLEDLRKATQAYLAADLSFIYSDKIIEGQNLGDEISKLNKMRYHFFYSDSTFQPLNTSLRSDWNINSMELLNAYSSEFLKVFEKRDSRELNKILNELEALSSKKRINPEHLIESAIGWISFMKVKSGYNVKDNEFHYHIRNAMKISELIAQLGIVTNKLIKFYMKAQSNSKKPKLREIDQYIINHLSENISSVDMANYLYLNPSYFSHYFKQLSGENFTDYMHRFKMRVATNLLQENNESIEIIASQLGYSDRTYFSKIFKKYTGCSPGKMKARSVKIMQELI